MSQGTTPGSLDEPTWDLERRAFIVAELSDFDEKDEDFDEEDFDDDFDDDFEEELEDEYELEADDSVLGPEFQTTGLDENEDGETKDEKEDPGDAGKKD
jgi:hypothetical protein